jgi:hypothetical protein
MTQIGSEIQMNERVASPGHKILIKREWSGERLVIDDHHHFLSNQQLLKEMH